MNASADSVVIRLTGVWKDYRVRTVGVRELKDIVRGGLLRRKRLFLALRGIDLEVRRGESLGVIGPNGAGKSTLLKLIAGTTRPQRGHVQVTGRVSALLELGAGFHPEFSGRENVLLNAIILGMSKREIEARFDDIVQFSGVGAVIDQPVKTYSSGMFVRLAFSVAVHTDPQILLVDEVLAVGDEAFQNRCVERVQKLRRNGVTIVLVTHDLARVKAICDRAVWLQDGEIRLQGDPVRVCDVYVRSVQGPQRQPDAVRPQMGDDTRWGTGEARIESLELLQDVEQARSESHVTLVVRYRAGQPVAGAVLGVALLRDDGLTCWGSSRTVEALGLPRLDSDTILRVVFQSLPLAPGSYFFDAAIHSAEGQTYDYWRRALRFRVAHDGRQEEGLVRLEVDWQAQAASAQQ